MAKAKIKKKKRKISKKQQTSKNRRGLNAVALDKFKW